MLEPERDWKTFESIEEELEKLREWKLISSKATEVKQFYYKGAYTDKPVECKVAGFVDNNEIILIVYHKFRQPLMRITGLKNLPMDNILAFVIIFGG